MGLSTAYSPAGSGLVPAPLGAGAGAARRRSAQVRRPRLATVRCSVDAAKQVQDGVATAVAAEAPASRKECFGVFCNIYDLKAEDKTKSWKKLVNIAVSGAAGMISNHLLFKLASGEVFGQDQPIALKLLGSERSFQALEGVAMELEDSLYPLLREVSIGIDPYEVFQDVDWALLIGAKPRGPGMERAALLDINGQIFADQVSFALCSSFLLKYYAMKLYETLSGRVPRSISETSPSIKKDFLSIESANCRKPETKYKFVDSEHRPETKYKFE